MSARPEIVITGVGLVSPIGIGNEASWASLREHRSGIGPVTRGNLSEVPVHLAGEVREYEPKQYVRPRKSLKVMTRPMQFGVTAAQFAWEDAGLAQGAVDPERVAVVFGADTICTPINEAASTYDTCIEDGTCNLPDWALRAQEVSFPLGMLKTLPNLVACHISISLDARGPNNTHHQGDISSLMAISEGMRVIERGASDVAVVGGASAMIDDYDWARSLAIDELSRADGQGASPRPFDLDRDGQVRGEGAAALILESRRHAEARGAKVLARLAGYGAAADTSPRRAGGVSQPKTSAHRPPGEVSGLSGGLRPPLALVRAIDTALRDARLAPGDVGHLNAHGIGTITGDRQEATAIGQVFNGVAVTAPKSFVGNLAAASGAVETAVSVLALDRGEVPVTLNHRRPDPACPLKVIHDEPLTGSTPVAMVVNQTPIGQAAALVLAEPK